MYFTSRNEKNCRGDRALSWSNTGRVTLLQYRGGQWLMSGPDFSSFFSVWGERGSEPYSPHIGVKKNPCAEMQTSSDTLKQNPISKYRFWPKIQNTIKYTAFSYYRGYPIFVVDAVFRFVHYLLAIYMCKSVTTMFCNYLHAGNMKMLFICENISQIHFAGSKFCQNKSCRTPSRYFIDFWLIHDQNIRDLNNFRHRNGQ
jgi:hypothetical protein